MESQKTRQLFQSFLFFNSSRRRSNSPIQMGTRSCENSDRRVHQIHVAGRSTAKQAVNNFTSRMSK